MCLLQERLRGVVLREVSAALRLMNWGNWGSMDDHRWDFSVINKRDIERGNSTD